MRYVYRKRYAETAGLIYVSAEGLDFRSPIIWSYICRRLQCYGLPTSVLLLVTPPLELMHVLLSLDHWHHDVVAGSALGILTACFSYRLYFPSLASKLAHLPYAPRIQHLAPQGQRLAPRIQRLEATQGSFLDTLPFYRSSLDELEPLHGTLRRDKPQREHISERGPSVERGRPSVGGIDILSRV
jgi:hypothetical protein